MRLRTRAHRAGYSSLSLLLRSSRGRSNICCFKRWRVCKRLLRFRPITRSCGIENHCA